jgi:ADP-ribose pyrophosphatase YjhB (NUDIX family)
LVDVISKIYNQEKFEFKDWKKFSLATNSDKIFAELIKRGYDGTVDIMDLDFAKSATIIFNPKKSFENPEFQNINEAVEYVPMPNPTQDGFYKPGKKSWYSRVMVNGYSYRERVETLIIDHRFGDRDYVLINFKNDGTYELPGGGSEPNMTLEDSAIRECREEVRIEVSGLLYCGQYALTYDRPGDDYYGVINHVFIGKRAQKYEGHIDLEDRDPDMLQNSKWYEVNTIFNKLRPEHKKAIGLYRSRYITTIPRESNMTHNVDGLLTEGTCPKYKRSELPDEAFGIPQERKYPLHTKKNVISAAKLFNHVENKYEKQLAKAIIKRGKQFDVDFSFVGDKNRLKKYLIKAKLVNERTDNMDMSSVMMAEFFGESSENDSKINDKIEPFVKKIEAKGYEVKYSSPGYANTRFDNDRDKNGVINAKMVTTGRIIFARDYHFDETPQGWTWKVMNNGAKALYVKPYTYNPRMGNEETAFKKWQEFYLSNLADWIERLDNCGKDNKENPEDTNFSK